MIAALQDKAPTHPGLITVSVMLATIMQTVDSTIANVSLPHMQGSLAATQDQIAWVLTSYIVASAIMTPATGFLAGRFGRKRLIAGTVFGFTIASLLCGMSTSLPQLVFFRLLQGVFGAGLVPLSQSVLLDTYPRERHGQAMAMWGAGIMVGPILGPTLGGYLTEAYGWPSVFYINLPVGILAFLGILAFVPDTERDRERRFDYLGFGLLALSIGAMQLMADRGTMQDWFSSTEIIVEAVVCGLCFYLFIVHVLTAERSFIEPRLFRDRNFAAGMTLMFIIGGIFLASLALLPPFLQNLAGYPITTTGNLLVPRGLGMMMAMLTVGRILQYVDARLTCVTGLGILSFSLWMMAGFTTDVSIETIAWTGAVQGLGLGIVFVSLGTLTFSTLDPRLRNEGTAFFSLMRNLGFSIGVSVSVTYLSHSAQTNHALLAEYINPLNPLISSGAFRAFAGLSEGAKLAMLNAEVTKQAFTVAYINNFFAMTYLVLMVIPLLLLPRGQLQPRPA